MRTKPLAQPSCASRVSVLPVRVRTPEPSEALEFPRVPRFPIPLRSPLSLLLVLQPVKIASLSSSLLQIYIMSWAAPQSWLTSMMGPSPLVIAITALLVLSIPLFLHFLIYRSNSATLLPSFLLIGPSGSGKTSLLTLVTSTLRLLQRHPTNHVVVFSSNEAILRTHTRLKYHSLSRCLYQLEQLQHHQDIDRSMIHHYKSTGGSC